MNEIAKIDTETAIPAANGSFAVAANGNRVDPVEELWRQFRGNQIAYKEKEDEFDAGYDTTGEYPFDLSPITEAHGDRQWELFQLAVDLPVQTANRAAVLLLMELPWLLDDAGGIYEGEALNGSNRQGRVLFEALNALRPSLTGQIAADVGELADNPRRRWTEFRWLCPA